jgi:ribosomal protein S18 acetylase RimI-like enzyme
VAVSIADAIVAGRTDDAAALVFEYLAITQAEMGRPSPAGIGELPPALQRECRDPGAVYRQPGTLLVAYAGGQPAGCVGLMPWSHQPALQVRRLYVRPAWRRQGIARALMGQAHHHAARHGITRLVLNVLPARTGAIGFYRGLGYRQAEPYATGSPVPMIYLQRLVTDRDISPPGPAPDGPPGGRWWPLPGRTG